MTALDLDKLGNMFFSFTVIDSCSLWITYWIHMPMFMYSSEPKASPPNCGPIVQLQCMMKNKHTHTCHWEVFSVLWSNHKQQKMCKASFSELRKKTSWNGCKKNGKKDLKTLKNGLHQEISSQYTNTTNAHNTPQKQSIPKNS